MVNVHTMGSFRLTAVNVEATCLLLLRYVQGDDIVAVHEKSCNVKSPTGVSQLKHGCCFASNARL